MTFECPKCKSPVARDGQRFCYRCGHDLNAYYDSLKSKSTPGESTDSPDGAVSSDEAPAPPTSKPIPSGTVVLEPNAFETNVDTTAVTTPHKATLKILLPTGDVFDRDLINNETQIGKGPRNDIVIADPAVSAAHAMVRLEGDAYKIEDIGSRNGTFVNAERVAEPRQLSHGDVIGIGLSKLTFRLSDYSETGAIDLDELVAAGASKTPPPLTEESLALAVVSAGLVSKNDVDRVRADGSGRRLYRALVEERLAAEEPLRDLMSRTFQIPVVDLFAENYLFAGSVDEAVVAEFPARLSCEHRVFPVTKEADSLVLAVSDPTDTDAVEKVKREAGLPVSIRLATATQIQERIDRHYCPKLIGVLPTGDKLEYPIDKHEVEIGKAAHNHIVLTDPTVSNTHAIVLSREGGYSIVDLGSRNGTFVNFERLGSQAHTLRHGDKVQLGQTVLTFRNPGETRANVTAVLSGAALEEVRRRAGATDDERAVPAAEATGGGAGSSIGPSAESLELANPESEAAEAADQKGEKKKKKKKKGKDERLKAAYISGVSRILAQVIAVVLTVGLTLYIAQRSFGPQKSVIETSSKGKAKLKIASSGAGTGFSGGTFEASGVTFVPGTDGVLFVDDNRPGEVLWMQLNESGRQVGEVKAIPLGVQVDDPEGITSDGTFFYIASSQSDPKAGDLDALARFAFDPATQTVQKAEVMTNLRGFLASIPELKAEVEKKGSDGGFNIEGIAWDFKRGRLLLGLRSPLGKDGQAQIVAVKLRDPTGAFTTENLQLAEPHPISLPLGGLGIRDIQYDPELNSFLIISGAPEHHEKTLFTLWEWDGSPEPAGSEMGLRKEADLDPKMKPEGVTHVEIRGRKFIFIVGDASSYIKLDYSEAQ